MKEGLLSRQALSLGLLSHKIVVRLNSVIQRLGGECHIGLGAAWLLTKRSSASAATSAS